MAACRLPKKLQGCAGLYTSLQPMSLSNSQQLLGNWWGDFSIAACGCQRVSDHSLDLCDGGLLENIGNLVC